LVNRAQPYSAAFFGGALDILQKSSQTKSLSSAEARLVVCALDLLAVLCANNGGEFWQLAVNFSSSGDSSMLHLIEECSSCTQIRQSTCVLLGAISKVMRCLKDFEQAACVIFFVGFQTGVWAASQR